MSNITVITLNKFGKRARGCCVHVFLVTYTMITSQTGQTHTDRWIFMVRLRLFLCGKVTIMKSYAFCQRKSLTRLKKLWKAGRHGLQGWKLSILTGNHIAQNDLMQCQLQLVVLRNSVPGACVQILQSVVFSVNPRVCLVSVMR